MVGKKKSDRSSRIPFTEQAGRWMEERPKPVKWLLVAALAVLIAAMPAFGNWWVRILINTGLMLMCALGLNVILGNVGQFHLGYVAFYGIGAYLYAILASPHLGLHVPFLLVFVLAGILTGILGAVLSIPTARLRGDYLALVTLAFGEVFYLIVNNMQLTNGALGIMSIDKPDLGILTLDSPGKFYYAIAILVALEAFLLHRISQSRIGRGMAAIREDEDAAGAMGLNTKNLKILANGIGAVPAGLAGVLFAASQSFVSPVNFTSTDSTLILSMVVVGGTGNVFGVILGVLLLTILPEPLRRYMTNTRMLFYAVLLLCFAVRRPQGLWKASHRISRIKKDQVRRILEAGENR
ncbi:branched-chain amino acid ABC transporter permease [Cuneatibacter sp. NSJ-177]|uniref:branched-chain amino acid ABC transporter permease n=1 Tax=Cuneatibacter sp. NSJ-177 TaxID=2931401 RepID=UPI001FD26A4E|nr:branched-chain amino acid ABC transporter permease [Cuneatibacter sp. NSJ-177]MCJ7834618.1 branched-chain amino acid ABC transporter permease [Cuneatibacter sp. NSJ-177]